MTDLGIRGTRTPLSPIFFIFTVPNEVAKVMFLQVCVCPRGGDLPGLGGVWSRGVSVPGGAWSQGGCLLTGEYLVLEVSATGGCPVLGGVCSGGRGAWSQGVDIPACTEADPPPPPGETATAADGMHPT